MLTYFLGTSIIPKHEKYENMLISYCFKIYKLNENNENMIIVNENVITNSLFNSGLKWAADNGDDKEFKLFSDFKGNLH